MLFIDACFFCVFSSIRPPYRGSVMVHKVVCHDKGILPEAVQFVISTFHQNPSLVCHIQILLASRALLNSESPHIITPLTQHPNRSNRTNSHRRPQTLPPLRAPKNQPLTKEMRESDSVRPETNLVNLRIGDVVRGVHAHDTAESGPGSKCPGGEGVDGTC